jgi:Fe-Mn family superoxide dismutase
MQEQMRQWIQLVEAKQSREKTMILEKLPYDKGDLAPVLSKDNVEYHYNVLSRGYVDRYNAGEGNTDFNYGGAKLHNLFWAQLQAPRGSNLPQGTIKEFINHHHKSFDVLIEETIKKAMTIHGSGWVIIMKNGEINTIPNQSYKANIAIAIDMWEHSFMDYIPAKNAKKKYITNIFKILNWSVINDRLNTK